MSKIIFIVGLPGAGKSRYFQKHYGSSRLHVLFDEYQKDNIGSSREFDKSANFDQLKKVISEGKIPVVIDPQYCENKWIDNAVEILGKIEPGIEINRIYFENSPEQCKANVKHRREEEGRPYYGEEDTISQLSSKYTLPEGIKAIPVYLPSKNV